MALPLPGRALTWLYAATVFACLYGFRALIDDIPPQDHIALSLILCFLLTQGWFCLEQTRLRISLSHNRCWLRHHYHGTFREQSIPVSQIHSARLEYRKPEQGTDALYARIVLITSLGMIPASHSYSEKPWLLDQICNHINHFLESQKQFMPA